MANTTPPQQPDPEQTSPAPSRGTLSIAILLISAFILFVGLIIFYNYNNGGLDLTAIEKVGAIWGPWVGAILGYYFGSRSSESLAENNKNLSREAGKKDQKLIHTKELLLRYRNNLTDDILKLTNAHSVISKLTGIAATDLQPLD